MYTVKGVRGIGFEKEKKNNRTNGVGENEQGETRRVVVAPAHNTDGDSQALAKIGGR